MDEVITDSEAYWYRDRHLGAEARTKRLVRKKVIVLFMSEAADLLVDDRWYPVFAMDLPVSLELRQQLETRRREYRDILAQNARARATSKSLSCFIREGLSSAVAIKAELPDWTVAIGDVHGFITTPSGGFCPEVFLDGQLGPCPVAGLEDVSAAAAQRYHFDTQALHERIMRAPARLCAEYKLKYAGPKPTWWHERITDEAIRHYEEILSRRELTVFAEYSSDGLLDFEFEEMRVRDLPIPEVLKEQVLQWSDRLEQFDHAQNDSDDPIDWRPFADQGYTLSVALKRALPDWTIHYADQFLYYAAPDGNYCPEVFADGTLGPCRVAPFKNHKVKDMRPAFIRPKPNP